MCHKYIAQMVDAETELSLMTRLKYGKRVEFVFSCLRQVRFDVTSYTNALQSNNLRR